MESLVPFIGLLLSMSMLPLLAPKLWHLHYGKISVLWAALTVAILSRSHPSEWIQDHLLHTALEEYIPFVSLIFALYVVSSGMAIHVGGTPSARNNTLFLLIGALFSNIIGTAGASILLIRPFLKFNHTRTNKTHLVIFFIFLVSNIGGCLTPIGDPPLFLGFLNGISFSWPLHNLGPAFLMALSLLLVVFFVLDSLALKKEDLLSAPFSIRVDGKVHFTLIFIIVFLVVLSGLWNVKEGLQIGSVFLTFDSLVRDFGLIGIGCFSLLLRPVKQRVGHEGHWAPFLEVAKLFFGIFITLIPVMQELQQISISNLSPSHYFWFSGIMSAFLDNAPAYLVFFKLSGLSPELLAASPILVAISLGSVFFGALTYIGNAPNFMVASLSKTFHVSMPSFVGYMAWSFGILIPVFAIVNWLFVG